MNGPQDAEWLIGGTSTVYMSGKAVYNIRRYGKPGIITTVEMFPADAEEIRASLRDHDKRMEAAALRDAAAAIRLDGGTALYYAAKLDGWADAIEATS